MSTVRTAPYSRSSDIFLSFLVSFCHFVIKKGLEKNSENFFGEIEKISRGILEREKNFKKNFRQIKKFQEKKLREMEKILKR